MKRIEFSYRSRARIRRLFARLIRMGSALTLDITNNDIKNGVAGDPRDCPAARAARRLFPDALYMYAAGASIVVHYVDGWTDRWWGGEALAHFIADVDGRRDPIWGGETLAPFIADVDGRIDPIWRQPSDPQPRRIKLRLIERIPAKPSLLTWKEMDPKTTPFA